MGGGNISRNKTIFVLVSLLFFMIAIGSAAAADMDKNITDEDISFDYTQEISDMVSTAEDADSSADISQNKNKNLTDENSLKASKGEVLGTSNDDDNVLSASKTNLWLYEYDDPNNTTLVYADTSSITLWLYNALSSPDYSYSQLKNALQYEGIRCTVYIDGENNRSPTYLGYLTDSGTSSLSQSMRNNLGVSSGHHTIQYYFPGYSSGSMTLEECWSNKLDVYVGVEPEPEIELTLESDKVNATSLNYGDKIRIKGTLTGVTGNIKYTFSDGTSSKTLSSGTSFDYTPKASGKVTVTAAYGEISKTLVYNVVKLSLSPNVNSGSTVYVGNTISITGTVEGIDGLTGVSIKVNGRTLLLAPASSTLITYTVNGGTAQTLSSGETFTYKVTQPGDISITATYGSLSETLTYTAKNPEITITPSTTNIYLGDTITLIGTLTGASGDITYTFSDGTSPVTKASGASFSYTPLASGNVRVTATNGNLTKKLDLYVIPAIPTYIELDNPVTAMVSGETITFHPVVYDYEYGNKYSKGTISMYVDGSSVATGVAPDSDSTFGSNLAVGNHTLRIVYSGFDDTDARYKGSSYAIDFVVNEAGSKNYVLYANGVTELYAPINIDVVFSVTGTHDPGQLKVFKDGSDTGKKFKPAESLTYHESAIGTHYYTVTNGGSPSNRVTIHWIYGFRDTETSVSVYPKNVTIKEPVNIYAIATYNGNEVSGGKVVLYVDGNEVNSAEKWVSAVSTPNFVTTYYATGKYNGFLGSDGYYYRPSSETVSYDATNIKASNTNVTLSLSNISVGQSVNITPTVTSGNTNIENAIVFIYVDGKLVGNTTHGKAFVYTNTTVAGIHNVTARYLGGEYNDFIYKASNSTVKLLQINKIDVNVSISVPQVTYNGQVIATITTNATGNFTVYINGKKYDLEIKNGTTGVVNHTEPIAAGNDYEASVTYNENYKYKNATATTTFNVAKAGSEITVTGVHNATYNGDVEIYLNVENATSLTVSGLPTGATYAFSNDNKKLTISGLNADTYAITINNEANTNYTGDIKTVNVKVDKASTSVNVPETTTVVHGSSVNVICTDLINASGVTAYLYNGNNQVKQLTVQNGKIIVDANNVDVGSYKLVVTTIPENGNYYSVTVNKTVTVTQATSSVTIPQFDDYKYGTNQDVAIGHVNTTSITATIDGSTNYIEINGYTITLKAGLTVGEHTLKVTGKGDKNHKDSEDSYTFNVLRVDKVWISEDGTGLGVTESDPTTWDKVADILTDDGTVVFVGNFDEFYNKTISKPWTLTSTSNSVINANNKGSIFTVNSDNVTVVNLTFKNGNAKDGGAIYWNGANGTLKECTFINNTAESPNNYGEVDGGAVYWGGIDGTLSNCIFINNTAKAGGAVYWFAKGGNLSNCRFIGNNATQLGGAVDWQGNNGNMSYCQFENNAVTENNQYGGAMELSGDNVIVSFCNFTNNKVNGYGGAIDLYGSDNKILNCTFTNNTATNGGAIYVYCENAEIIGSTFINNTAATGGALYWDGENGLIDKCTFTGNVAAHYFNIYTGSDDLNLINSNLETKVLINNVEDGPFNCTRIIEGTFDEGTNLGGYTVKLLNNNGEVTEVTIKNDKTFSYTWNNLNVGDYSITLGIANTKGNTYVTDYEPMTFKIYKANSSVSIDEINSVNYPDAVTVSFNVLNETTVTYIVKTKDGKTVIENTTVDTGVRALTLSGLGAGEYTITIANAENANFTGNEASADFKVNKSASSLDELTPVVFDYGSSGTISVDYSGATNVTAFVVGHPEAVVVVGDHNITVSGLDFSESGYVLNVTTVPDDNHTAVSKTTTVTVNKVNSTLDDLEPVEFTYGGFDTIDVDYSGATNVTAVVVGHPEAVVVVGDHKITVSGLGAGEYTLNVTTNPDGNHKAVSKTTSVKVNKAASSVSIDEISTVDYPNNVTVSFNVLNETTVTYVVKTKDGKTVIENTTVDAGVRVLTLSGLGAGEYTITIANAENDNFTSSVNSANFTVNNGKITSLTITISDVTYPDHVIALVNASVKGKYNVTVEGTQINVEVTIDTPGVAKEVDLGSLDVKDGYHAIVTSYIDNYATKTNETSFNVFAASSKVEIISVTNNTYPGNASVEFKVTNLTDVTFTVTKDGTPVSATVSVNGDVVSIGGLNAGVYSINITNAKLGNYNASSAVADFEIYQKETNVKITECEGTTYPNNVVVRFSDDNPTDVVVVVTKDGAEFSDYVLNLTDMTVTFTSPSVGEYVINITDRGNENVKSSSDKKTFTVSNGSITNLRVEVSDVDYPNRAHAVVYANVDGSYIVTVNNKNYTVTVKDGNGTSAEFDLLNVSEYNVTVTSNVSNYDVKKNVSSFNVKPANATLEDIDEIVFIYGESGDVTVIYSGATEIIASVVDHPEATVIVDGNVIAVSGLNASSYILNVTAVGDNNHNNVSKTGVVNVLRANPELSINVTSVTYPNNVTITVKSKFDGNYTVNINGTSYEVEVKGGIGTKSVLKPVNVYNATVSLNSTTNYNASSAYHVFEVTNGNISNLSIKVANVVYDGKTVPVAIVNASVASEYIITVDGTEISKKFNINESQVNKEVEINLEKVIPVNNYHAVITSNISNYAVKSADSQFNVTNGTISIDLNVTDITYPSNLSVIVKVNVTGEYIVYVDGVKEQNITLNANEQTTIDLGQKDVKSYDVKVVSNIANYNVAEALKTVNVTVGTITNLRVEVSDVDYPNRAHAVVYADVDGSYIVTVNNKNYTVTVKDGNGTSAEFELLNVSNYNVTVTSNVSNYDVKKNTSSFKVKPANATLEDIDEIVFIYGESGNVTVTYSGATEIIASVVGHPEATVKVDGNVITVSGLNASSYTLNVTAVGDNNHNNVSKTGAVNVLRANPELSITVTNETYPHNVTITVKSKFDGDYVVDINGTKVNVKVEGGIGTASVKKPVNVYNATVELNQTTNYNASSAYYVFEVSRNDTYRFYVIPVYAEIDHGQNITLYGMIDADDVTGNVTFTDFDHGLGVLGNATINKGLYVDSLHAAHYYINASYEGDSNYAPKSAIIELVVKHISGDVMIVEATPDNYTYSGNSTVRAYVTAYPDASGQVYYYIRLSGTSTENNKFVGISTINDEGIVIGNLTPGNYIITAEYHSSNGDYEFDNHTCRLTVKHANSSVESKNVEVEYDGKTITVEVISTENATNVTYHVYDKNNSLVDNGTVQLNQNITVRSLPVGDYTINLTTGVDENHTSITKSYNLKVINGTIGHLSIDVKDINYTADAHPIALVNASVAGNYTIRVNGTDIEVNFTIKDDEINTLVSVDLGKVLDVNKYNATVTSNIENYNTQTASDLFNVNKGKINVTVDVKGANYPDNATITVNATVDGNYTVQVGNGTYNVTVKNGTGNVTLPVLPAGEYPVNVTAEIPNYDSVNKAGDDLIIGNGTINLNVSVVNVDYPKNATVTVNADVDGNYTVNVNGTNYTAHVVDGTGNVTVNVLPVGEYPVTVTAVIPNYNPVNNNEEKVIVSNGTITLQLDVENIIYPANLTVNVTSDVSGDYMVFVGGVNVKNITLSANVTKLVDLGQKPVGTYNVEVVSNVANYAVATAEGVVNVTNGTIGHLSIDVKDINYTADAHPIALVNASVAGNYTIRVNGTDIEVNFTIKDDEINTLVPVDLGKVLDVNKYNATVTSNIENYETKTASDLFNVFDGKIDVNVTVKNPTYPQNATVTVNATVDGIYNVTVGNKTYPVNVKNGTGNVTIDVLPAGEHQVNVTAEIPNYKPVNNTDNKITVSKGIIDVNVIATPATYPNNATITVNADVDGNYTVIVGNHTYEVEVIGGSGNKTIDVLPADKYPVNVTAEIPNYNPVNKAGNDLIISNGTISINLYPENIAYPSNLTIKVSANVTGDYLINVAEANIVNKTVHLTANNVTVINLGHVPAGKYTVNITSNIKNYNVASAQEVVNVTDGEIDFNVTVVNPTYPDNATIIVNATVDGNYTVKVGNGTYNVTVKNGTGNVTLPVLPAGNYTVNVTSNVPNYEKITKDANLTVGNGTIGLELTVDPVTYPDNVIAVIETNVTGQYIVTVDGKDPQVVDLKNGTPYELDLGVLPAGNHTVKVVSNITNYNKAENSAVAVVNNGTIGVNVTVVPADYPGNATIIVNATVDGDYNVTVGNESYPVHVENGTGNVTLPVLPAGNYTVNVTGEIPNYSPVNVPGDDLIIGNGTIDLKLDIKPVTYPDNVIAVIETNVTGQYIVTVDGKDPRVVDLVNGTPYELDLGVLPAGNHTVKVVSNITNYNKAENSAVAVVNNGTIGVNVTVNPADYPGNATITVNATVDGNYTVQVGNETYNVTVENGTGNVTLPVLPAGNYTVNVTGEIPNYSPVNVPGDDLIIGNGTIGLELTVDPVTYPDNVIAVIETNVTGQYIVTVDGKDPQVVNLVNGTPYELDLGVLPAGNHTVKVVSNITNYNRAENSTTAVVNNGTINVDVEVINAKYPEQGKVIVKADVDGDYTVNVNGTDYIAHVVDGIGNVTVDVLPTGEYPVKVTAEIPNYNPVDKDGNLVVSNGTIDMNVTVVPADYPDNATVIVNSTVDGNYTVTVDNKTYPVEVINGTGNVTLPVLPAGNYTVNVTSNVPNYENVTKTENLTVSNGTIALELTVDPVTYPDNVTAVIKTNVTGEYIITVDGGEPIKVTLTNSTPNEVDLGVLPAGNHTVKVVSNIENYNKAEDTKTATVNPGKVDMNITVINPTYPDNATVIVNSTVDGNYTVTVDNKTYPVEVKNGTGNVTIDQLPQGKHNVTVESNITNYENTTKTAEVDVAAGKLDYNVTVTNPTYPDKAQVTITSNVDGDYVVEVNGKQYDAKVVNGKATVDVDQLPAGTYPVKVTSKVPNYETTTKDATLTVKAAPVVDDNVKLKVTLRDANGKVLKNKKVVFTYNGKTFTVKTNSKGVATITVKKSDTQTNGVINLKKVNGKKVKATWISKFKYSTKFKDKKGKAIAGKKVTIRFNGKVYKVKTNKKGVATVTFKNIKAGKYKIVAKYKKIVHKATVNIKG